MIEHTTQVWQDLDDVTGYAAPLYDDGEGYKGRPRKVEGTGGGGAAVKKLYPNLDPYKQAARLAPDIPGLFIHSFS